MDLIVDTQTQSPTLAPSPAPFPDIPAGFWARMTAFSIDMVLLLIPLAVLDEAAEWYLNAHPEAWLAATNYFFRALDGTSTDKMVVIAGLLGLLVVLLLPYDLYFIFMERWWGATLGKHWLGLQVKDKDSRPLTLKQCWVRQLFRHIDVILILPALAGMLFTEQHLRLGDAVAKTRVIRRPDKGFDPDKVVDEQKPLQN